MGCVNVPELVGRRGESSQMKITHVIIGLTASGAELMLYRLVENLNGKENMQHSVISLTTLGPVGKRLQDAGIEVMALGMSGPLSLPSIFFKLKREIKKQKPDIIQTWMYHADLLGGLAAKSLGVDNIIWGIRTTDVTLGRSKATIVLRKLCALLSHSVPKLIVCAAEAGRKVHVQVGYDSRKMIVIPNGFELNKLKATPQQRKLLRDGCGFVDNELVIGSVGRFDSIKNQKLFIEVAALVVAKHANARFLMVGRDNTWDNIQLVNWIERYNLESKFVLLGERSDVPVCLAIMDVFCLHSKTEGFPNVLGEAMAMGLPCVATNVGDAKVIQGNTGKTVGLNAVSISNGINELLNLDKPSLVEVGEQAREQLRNNYSLPKIIRQYSNIYKSLI